jgi:DNA-binding transcriptional LysR family regulator
MAGTVRIIGLVDFLAEVAALLLVPLLEDGVRVRLQAGYRTEVVQRLIEGDGDLGFVGYEVEDRRVRCESLREESAIAVAAPAVVERLAQAGDLRAALHAEPLLAYNLERPLVDMWLAQTGWPGSRSSRAGGAGYARAAAPAGGGLRLDGAAALSVRRCAGTRQAGRDPGAGGAGGDAISSGVGGGGCASRAWRMRAQPCRAR